MGNHALHALFDSSIIYFSDKVSKSSEKILITIITRGFCLKIEIFNVWQFISTDNFSFFNINKWAFCFSKSYPTN